MSLKVFKGVRSDNNICSVTVQQVDAPTYYLYDFLNVRNHSPSGFEWGYSGSGPAQLAVAILCDIYGPESAEVLMYQDFKSAVIVQLPKEKWELTEQNIRAIVDSLIISRDIHKEAAKAMEEQVSKMAVPPESFGVSPSAAKKKGSNGQTGL